MRVALFTDTYAPDVNGVAKTLSRWQNYLERQGIPCRVFAPLSAKVAAEAQPSPVERFASLPFFLYPECRLAIPNPIHLRQALRQFQPTLIHVATPFNLGLYGLHYARKYDIPLVASYHTNFDRYLSFYNLQWMEKLLWRYMEWFHRDCGRLFVPSANTFTDLARRGWDESRMSVWGRGIDSSAYHPFVNRKGHLSQHNLQDCPFVALYVGRLAPEKDLETAIEAFSRFQRLLCPEAVFVIAGEGPSAPALKELCIREGVNAKFIGMSHLPELQRWYASADVLLFPSATETFGNVVLESMACGTPVICANAGGVLDSVRDGLTGLLCEPGNPSSFGEALALLWMRPAYRHELAGMHWLTAGLNPGRQYSTSSWPNAPILQAFAGRFPHQLTPKMKLN